MCKLSVLHNDHIILYCGHQAMKHTQIGRKGGGIVILLQFKISSATGNVFSV